MTCRGGSQEYVAALAPCTGLSAAEVDAAAHCIKCDRPLSKAGRCPKGHAQVAVGTARDGRDRGAARSAPPAQEVVFSSAVQAGRIDHSAKLGEGMFGAEVRAYTGDGKGVWKRIHFRMGDRWLHDGNNEVAADCLDRLLGVDVVPETVFDPGRTGTSQRFVENGVVGARASPRSQHDVLHKQPERYYAILALDIILGNPDRHIGNYIYDERGRVWAIDHGLATWLPFGQPPLGFQPLTRSHPLLFHLGHDMPPEGTAIDEILEQGQVVFPPEMVARWREITEEQFYAAFADAGVSEEGRVKLRNGWANLQYILDHDGVIAWQGGAW